jgi:hypothetical protein
VLFGSSRPIPSWNIVTWIWNRFEVFRGTDGQTNHAYPVDAQRRYM